MCDMALPVVAVILSSRRLCLMLRFMVLVASGRRSLGREKDVKKLVRFQHNPRENWGPMAKAKGKA